MAKLVGMCPFSFSITHQLTGMGEKCGHVYTKVKGTSEKHGLKKMRLHNGHEKDLGKGKRVYKEHKI